MSYWKIFHAVWGCKHQASKQATVSLVHTGCFHVQRPRENSFWRLWNLTFCTWQVLKWVEELGMEYGQATTCSLPERTSQLIASLEFHLPIRFLKTWGFSCSLLSRETEAKGPTSLNNSGIYHSPSPSPCYLVMQMVLQSTQACEEG